MGLQGIYYSATCTTVVRDFLRIILVADYMQFQHTVYCDHSNTVTVVECGEYTKTDIVISLSPIPVYLKYQWEFHCMLWCKTSQLYTIAWPFHAAQIS